MIRFVGGSICEQSPDALIITCVQLNCFASLAVYLGGLTGAVNFNLTSHRRSKSSVVLASQIGCQSFGVSSISIVLVSTCRRPLVALFTYDKICRPADCTLMTHMTFQEPKQREEAFAESFAMPGRRSYAARMSLFDEQMSKESLHLGHPASKLRTLIQSPVQ